MKLLQRLTLILLTIASLTLAGCNNDFDPISDGDNVVYMGTFMRSGPLIDTGSSNVTLRFRDGVFEGTSTENNYPAICNGTYSVKGTKINFRNKCIFPANFDWGLILAGDFDYEQRGDSLIIRRGYEGGVYDQYKLRKGS